MVIKGFVKSSYNLIADRFNIRTWDTISHINNNSFQFKISACIQRCQAKSIRKLVIQASRLSHTKASPFHNVKLIKSQGTANMQTFTYFMKFLNRKFFRDR